MTAAEINGLLEALTVFTLAILVGIAVISKDEGSIGCCKLCVRHLGRNKK